MITKSSFKTFPFPVQDSIGKTRTQIAKNDYDFFNLSCNISRNPLPREAERYCLRHKENQDMYRTKEREQYDLLQKPKTISFYPFALLC
ncbi:CLUMA_CG019226, isoform A [Clunio marinus]|uniref:CLUMA_CG019226, isoform A n=1 Tax=Clunio marinus TaxID=568069 RepID=A0A1J1J1F7_9DIPT|nr:CLUMA_CG019226, isoform A [Clunio marinus]